MSGALRMSVLPRDLLSAFGESILLLDASRTLVCASGDTTCALDTIPDPGCTWDRLLQHASTEAADSLYWAIEAAFEHHVPLQFIPKQFPFKPGIVAAIAL